MKQWKSEARGMGWEYDAVLDEVDDRLLALVRAWGSVGNAPRKKA